jgi:hypothetical protein
MTQAEKCIAYMDALEDEYLRLEPRESYDLCIVGVAQRFNTTVLAYSVEKILAMHVADGMTEEEASEYFEYNTMGAWLGDGTPVFMRNVDFMEEENGE